MTWTRRLLSAAAFTALLASLALPSTASGVEIYWVYPPPNSLVTESPVTVLGYVLGAPEATLAAKVVTADPTVPPKREVLYLFKGKVLSGAVALEPGRNNVLVGDSVLPLLYRPGLEEGSEGAFRTPLPHAGGITSCNPCHGFQNGEITFKEPVSELCVSCHRVGTESLRAVIKKNKHTDSITPDCLACHDPHASFEKHLLRSAETVCTDCHKTQASCHEAGSPSCTACHDSHASAYPQLLKGDASALCQGCHAELSDPQRYPRSYHRPVEEGRCLQCHGHHPSRPEALTRSPLPDLCRECHAKKDQGGHTGRLEECLTCHQSHRSDKPGLLAEEVSERCVACHPAFPDGVSNHPALKDGCVACHNPHEPRALGESQRACGRCHNLREEGFRWVHGQLAMASARQCTVCHEPHRSGYPSLLRGVVHYPLKTGGCNACHEKDGEDIVLRYEGSQNCTRCHGDVTGTSTVVETDKVHRPVYQVDCIACHDPHLGTRDGFLLEEPETLCGRCHGLLLRGVKTVHGVFREKGSCDSCHLPHVSDFRPLLKRPEGELCTGCHPTVIAGNSGGGDRLHGALEQGRCTGCHDPHGTNTEKLLRSSRDGLCQSCHPAASQRPDGEPYRYLHGPVGSGNCTACHELAHQHGAAGEGFLRIEREAVCSMCHETPRDHVPEQYRYKMRQVRNDCLACHTPHGADNPFLVRHGL